MLERSSRQVGPAHVQQEEGAQFVESETPARVSSWKVGILLGKERAGRGAVQERATLVLMMEPAAARRKRGQLPTQS